MELIQLVLMMVNLTYSWKESMSITMKLLVEDMFQELF
jgi:hypothetical protein